MALDELHVPGDLDGQGGDNANLWWWPPFFVRSDGGVERDAKPVVPKVGELEGLSHTGRGRGKC